MPAFARAATGWVPLKAIPAWDGTKWTPTKAVWACGGDGRWHLVWVPPITAASLSFSKSPVQTGEPFNVIASVPAGTPVGAYAVFRSSEGHNYRVDFPTGSTTVTLAGHSHGPRGAHQWWVDFYTVSGKTTWGPVTQTALQAPPASASLSFSRSPVFVGQPFDVTATIPGGVPPTMYAIFRSTEGHYYAVYPTAGAPSVTLAGHSHIAGSWDWYVDLHTEGGMRTFGPLRQTANARSTVSLAGRDWVMASGAGDNGFQAAVIAANTLTVSLGTPSAVRHVSLQLSWAGAAGWVEYKAWDAPASSQTYDFSPSNTGNWQARAVITHTDGAQVVSNVLDIVCRTKHLQVTAGNPSPVYGQQGAGLVAACIDGCDVGADSHTFWARDVGRGGAWINQGTSGPDGFTLWNWVPWDGSAHDFGWVETFSDGSTLYSSVASVTPQAPYVPPSPYHVRAGYTQAEFQAVVDSRAGAQVLVEPGHYNFTERVFSIPAGVHIVSYDCTFTVHQGIVNAGYPVGGYGRAGGWTWEGGTFDGGGVRTTMFSLAHARSFTIKNVTIRGCKGKGHGIEINSSGGPVQSGYTVVIEGCTFDGVTGHRPQSEGPYKDEAIHFDYAWGTAAATAHPANDGTVCNNVWVKNNTVAHNPATGYATGYPVGFGAHKFGVSTTYHPDAKKTSAGNWICRPPGPNNTRGGYEGQARPVEYHTHFLIEGNTFHVSAYAGTGKRGAIHIRGADGFVVRNNSLVSPSGAAVVTYENEFTKNLSSSPAAVNI
jgi:hypothetical protein